MNYRQISLPILLILCFVFNTKTAKAQDELISNTELLHKVIEKSIVQLEDVLPSNADVSLEIQFADYDWFIRHRAIKVLGDLGYNVRGNNENYQDGHYKVELGVEQLGIRYDNVRKRSIFRSRTMTRHADVAFSLRISGDGRERVIRISEYVSDEIAYNKHREVENSALPFTQANVPDGSFTERLLGPAVIVGATGVVIYLFFSVRS